MVVVEQEMEESQEPVSLSKSEGWRPEIRGSTRLESGGRNQGKNQAGAGDQGSDIGPGWSQ